MSVGNALSVFPRRYFLSYSCRSYFPGNTFNSSESIHRIFSLAWDDRLIFAWSTVSPASMAVFYFLY
jgi:hypothetical protein